MTRVIIDVLSIEDAGFIEMVMNRMGFFPVVIQQEEQRRQKEIDQLKSIVLKGVRNPSVSLTQRLKDLEEDRQDRLLPYDEIN